LLECVERIEAQLASGLLKVETPEGFAIGRGRPTRVIVAEEGEIRLAVHFLWPLSKGRWRALGLPAVGGTRRRA
jgi:hypothetical protein